MTLLRSPSTTFSIGILLVSTTAALGLYTIFVKRKKPGDHCDTGGKNSKPKKIEENQEQDEKVSNMEANMKRSQSVPCNAPLARSPDLTGKSAPIDIAHNPRMSPKVSGKDLDINSVELARTLEQSDYKNLQAIEEYENEEFGDTPDLAGTYKPKNRYSVHEDPVEVKAAEVSNKICSSVDRDSANVSPVSSKEEDDKLNIDVNVEELNPPIASPPLSNYSGHSADSGKGSSPTESEGGVLSYTFRVRTVEDGPLLVGRKGRYMKDVQRKTGVKMSLQQKEAAGELQECTLEGTHKEIDAALRMLRDKFPLKRYPHLTFERYTPEDIYHTLDSMPVQQVQLFEGINNDVSISAVVSGGQVFLQQPLHPSYRILGRLHSYMNERYNFPNDAPLLEKFDENVVCAAPVMASNGTTNWYRVQIISHNPGTQSVMARFLDFGGYNTYKADQLRQIRMDCYALVPFQAQEVVLGGIRPVNGEWAPGAANLIHSFRNSKILLQAQIAGYSEDGYPEVYLFATIAKNNVVFINSELVAQKYAEWIDTAETTDTATA